MPSPQFEPPEVKYNPLTGLGFGESPRWHDNRLWFCNWGLQEVVAVDMEGRSQVMARIPTTIPFCIDWLDDKLLIVSGQERLLLRQESDGTLVTHADLTSLAQTGFNEIVRPRPQQHLRQRRRTRNQRRARHYCADLARRQIRQVAEGIAFPNGMAITPDNSTLIIAESHGKRLTAFDIASDGNLSNRRVWADLGEGVPDGICIDTENTIWYADVPNMRCVRVREGGAVLQTVNVDRGCFACMLGSTHRKTLFIVAAKWFGFAKMMEGMGSGQLLAINVSYPKAGWP